MSIESISLKFKSGNSVPVFEAKVTRDEWEAAKSEIYELRADKSIAEGAYAAAADFAESQDAQIKTLQARVAELEYAIEHAIDYWNRDYNEMAMKDALESMIEILLETKDKVKP